MIRVYPLTFTPIVQPKVWGAEYWHIADLDFTTGSDDPTRSVIDHGPLAGQTIHHLIEHHREAVMGRAALTRQGNFPLLIKYLEANENLSIQVHPTAEYVATHPGCHLKSEAWYVVGAEPGAVIYKGLVPGTTRQDIRDAIAENRLQELLRAVPVKPGDFHYLPSGSCHALGAGVKVAEVQTPSDTTFRLYDWGRRGRRLHIEQALACMKLELPPPPAPEPIEGGRRLLTSEHFLVDELTAEPAENVPLPPADTFRIWMILEGRGAITCQSDLPELTFTTRQTLLLPARMIDPQVRFDLPTRLLQITPSRLI